MASNKKSSGGGGTIGSIIGLFLLAAIIFAFLTSKGISMNNLLENARNHGSELGPKLVACATGAPCELSSDYKPTPIPSKKSSNNNNNSSSTSRKPSSNNSNSSILNNNNSNSSNNSNVKSNSSDNKIAIDSTSISKKEAQDRLNELKVVSSYDVVKYKRVEWKHWIRQGEFSNCSGWSTRDEVLDRQAVKGSVIYLDKNDKETKNKKEACNIKSGKWEDPYSSAVVTNPTELDIDHTVALNWAAQAGGQFWDKETKQKFANDFDQLVATTAKQNRTKGDKGPYKWMPENKLAHCDYSKVYIYTISKYKLNIIKEDKAALQNALNTCTS